MLRFASRKQNWKRARNRLSITHCSEFCFYEYHSSDAVLGKSKVVTLQGYVEILEASISDLSTPLHEKLSRRETVNSCIFLKIKKYAKGGEFSGSHVQIAYSLGFRVSNPLVRRRVFYAPAVHEGVRYKRRASALWG